MHLRKFHSKDESDDYYSLASHQIFKQINAFAIQQEKTAETLSVLNLT